MEPRPDLECRNSRHLWLGQDAQQRAGSARSGAHVAMDAVRHRMARRMAGDVVEEDGSHVQKAGPCVQFAGVNDFMKRRSKLDGCLTGCRLAKDRAGQAISQVEIPEKLDYPRS